MNFTAGHQFRLTRDHGSEPDPTYTYHPIPNGEPLRAGAVGTVEAVVPAEVMGAGNDQEDHVVLSFTDPAPRNVSFTQEQMDTLFEALPPPSTHDSQGGSL